MNHHNDYESKLWKVLEKEGLADLSQYHKPRFFEEVPLYSRLSDIAFLVQHQERNEVNAVLLRFALKFLKSVVSYEEHRTPYFAAITVWSFSEEDPVIPNLFVWSDAITPLFDKLNLECTTTRFGKRIKKTVARLRDLGPLDVCEDTSTSPEASRVFIGQSLPPYPSFVPLHTFRRPLSHAAK